jgi:hypothetical protein
VQIKVFEGERLLTVDNTLLGTFELIDLPPMPRKVPRIKVTFDIDINGILHVTALEETTGKTKKICIKRDNNRFDQDTLTKMIEDANKYKSIDTAIQATLKARNDLEKYIYSANATIKNIKLNEQFNSMPEDITIANSMLSEIISWFDANSTANATAFKEKHSAIESSLTPLICKLISQQAQIKVVEPEKVVEHPVEEKIKQDEPKEHVEPEELPAPELDTSTPEQEPEPVEQPKKEETKEPVKRRVGRPKKTDSAPANKDDDKPKKRGRKPNTSITLS